MISKEPKLVGRIDFLDQSVKVYYDVNEKNPNSVNICWRARNPDSFYTGSAFMSADGKLTYPEGAIIPKYTAHDREIMPQFVIIAVENFSVIKENIIELITTGHVRRNKQSNN